MSLLGGRGKSPPLATAIYPTRGRRKEAPPRHAALWFFSDHHGGIEHEAAIRLESEMLRHFRRGLNL